MGSICFPAAWSIGLNGRDGLSIEFHLKCVLRLQTCGLPWRWRLGETHGSTLPKQRGPNAHPSASPSLKFLPPRALISSYSPVILIVEITTCEFRRDMDPLGVWRELRPRRVPWHGRRAARCSPNSHFLIQSPALYFHSSGTVLISDCKVPSGSSFKWAPTT